MKTIIYLIALLAVAAGCTPADSHSITKSGHVYDYGRDIYNNRCYLHSDTCPAHRSLLVEITKRRAHILAAAPSGTILVPFPGEDVRQETDTINRFGKPAWYWCIQARMPSGSPAYLRLELDAKRNPTNVLHVHTSNILSDTCRFLFDKRGYYNGCNCGCNTTVLGLP